MIYSLLNAYMILIEKNSVQLESYYFYSIYKPDLRETTNMFNI